MLWNFQRCSDISGMYVENVVQASNSINRLFPLRIIQSWSDSILLSILNDIKLKGTFEDQLISQRQLYFWKLRVFQRSLDFILLVDEERLQALQQSLQHYFEDVLN